MKKKKVIYKGVPLRLTSKTTYPALEKIAQIKRWSVNTLINSILEDKIKEFETEVQK